MKYTEQKQVVEDLRAMADFYARPQSIELPYPYGIANRTEYVTEYTYDGGKSEVSVSATLDTLRRITKALGSCEKTYPGKDGSGQFTLTKKIGTKGGLAFSATGQATCERKLVGVETVEARFVPASTREVYEYECKPISLLGG